MNKKKYFICEVNNHDGITIKKEITFEKFKEMQNYTSQLKYYSLSRNYKDIAIKNGLELQKYFSALKSITNPEEINKIKATNIAIEINRLILNYLVSFRTFVDNVQKYSKHIEEGEKFVENVLKYIYDTENVYAFFYKLRNYATHHSLVVDSISLKMNGIEIHCTKEHLLEYDSWKAEHKKFLEACPEYIDISQYLEKMNILIMSIYLAFVNYLGLEFQKMHDDIIKLMKDYKILNPHVIECDAENEKTLIGAHMYGIGLNILKEATEELASIPNVKINYITPFDIFNGDDNKNEQEKLYNK